MCCNFITCVRTRYEIQTDKRINKEKNITRIKAGRGEGNIKSCKGRRKYVHMETVSDGTVYEGQVVLDLVSVHHDSAISAGSVISIYIRI